MPGTKHDDFCDAILNYILNNDDGGLTGAQHYVGLIDDETAIDYEASTLHSFELTTGTESNYARTALPAVGNWTIAAESGSGVGRQATNDNDISAFTATASYTIYGWFITDSATLGSSGNIRYSNDFVTPVSVVSGDIVQFSAGTLKIVEN